MITKINGMRIPDNDPVHHLTGAALESRLTVLASTLEAARLKVAKEYMNHIHLAENGTTGQGFQEGWAADRYPYTTEGCAAGPISGGPHREA